MEKGMPDSIAKTEGSFRLSLAVAHGRDQNGRPADRATVLLRLLEKRAAAHRAGLMDLEAIIRNQIEWALPFHHIEQIDEENFPLGID
jgi:hypothetical protein